MLVVEFCAAVYTGEFNTLVKYNFLNINISNSIYTNIKAYKLYNGRKGFFKPKNPHKYDGDPTNIIYRSWLEFRFMRKLDKDLNVIKWSSEELNITYRSYDNSIHRYFPDFIVTKLNSKNIKETFMIEIKPEVFTKPPKATKGMNKRFINEVKQYGVNTHKWKAAEAFCESRGWKFLIITEKDV